MMTFKIRNWIFGTAAGIWLGATLTFLSDYKLKFILAFGVALWFPVFVRLVGSVRRALMAILIFSLSTQMSFNPLYSEYFVKTRMGVRITLTGLALLASYISWIFLILQHQQKIHFKGKVTLPLLLLVIWAGLSYGWAKKPTAGTFLTLQACEAFLAYFITMNFIQSKDDLRFFLNCISVTLLMTATLTLIQYVKPNFLNLKFMGWSDEPLKLHFGNKTISRPSAFLGHANNLASFLTNWLPVIFIFIIGHKERTRERILWMLAFTLGVMALVVTFSRGGWIAFASSIMLISAIMLKKHTKRIFPKILPRIVALTFLAFVVILPFAPNIINRIIGDEHKAGESRIFLAQKALDVIWDRPMTGYGFGYYLDFDPVPPHNIYLQTTAELGFIGLLLFLWVSYGFFKQGWTGIHTDDEFTLLFVIGIFAGLFSAYLHGMLELGTIGYHKFLSYLVLGGLLVALGQENQSRLGLMKKGCAL